MVKWYFLVKQSIQYEDKEVQSAQLVSETVSDTSKNKIYYEHGRNKNLTKS